MAQDSIDERWTLLRVQAQRFAAQDHFTDALGRARLLVAELDEALSATQANGERKAELERLLAFARMEAEQYEREHEAWLDARRAMQRERFENAAEELARPLRRWA